jgi:hypothetical protein
MHPPNTPAFQASKNRRSLHDTAGGASEITTQLNQLAAIQLAQLTAQSPLPTTPLRQVQPHDAPKLQPSISQDELDLRSSPPLDDGDMYSFIEYMDEKGIELTAAQEQFLRNERIDPSVVGSIDSQELARLGLPMGSIAQLKRKAAQFTRKRKLAYHGLLSAEQDTPNPRAPKRVVGMCSEQFLTCIISSILQLLVSAKRVHAIAVTGSVGLVRAKTMGWKTVLETILYAVQGSLEMRC